MTKTFVSMKIISCGASGAFCLSPIPRHLARSSRAVFARPFLITAQSLASIGAGGMGEVYRARDTKLGRDVALKVLPDAFALQQDRLARFRREAQVLASLNHTNIAAIFGLEESSATTALVLEMVEGVTL